MMLLLFRWHQALARILGRTGRKVVHVPFSCTLHALGQEPTGDGCPFGHHQGRFPDRDDEGCQPDGTFAETAFRSDDLTACITESISIGVDEDDDELFEREGDVVFLW